LRDVTMSVRKDGTTIVFSTRWNFKTRDFVIEDKNHYWYGRRLLLLFDGLSVYKSCTEPGLK
jgi:hypothetical protein